MTKPSRILGLDYGLARMGVALSDESHMLATAQDTVLCSKKSEETAKTIVTTIEKIEKERRCVISRIVIGLPLMMNGSLGFLADEVRHFKQVLETLTPIPIQLWDERLTTVQAEKALQEAGLSRKKRSKHTDKLAAVLILQNFLDQLSFQKHLNNF